MRLTTEVELAERFHLTPEEAAEMRQKQKWPHVRLNRFKVRYTEEQIEAIVQMRTVEPKASAAGESGLTERSAARAGR